MLPATISWLAALTVWPEPAGPTCTMVLPTASSTGRAAVEVVRVAADHDGQRAPRSRPASPPDTGASSDPEARVALACLGQPAVTSGRMDWRSR